MKRIVAAFALPAGVGLVLGVAALVVVLDSGEEEPAGPPAALVNAERALFTEALLVKLAEGELNAFRLGGLDERPLVADPARRHVALFAYRGLVTELESLGPVIESLGVDVSRDEVLGVWSVHLNGALGWLRSQREYAQDPGFVKYMERPLTTDRPYMVEVDRLQARKDYERAVSLGRMALEQRTLAWRRAESLSSAALRRTVLADVGE
ncbi:MAG: hypothetical protein NTW26_06445 [bacterium]|nr:hypothetical protein [bacterium]